MNKAFAVCLLICLFSASAFAYQPLSKYEALENQKLGSEPIPVINAKHKPLSSVNRATLLSESFTDAAFPPAGWNVIQTNTGTQTGYPCYWSRYTAPNYTVRTEPAAAGLWWSYAHQDEWLISPEVSLTGSTTNRYYLRWWYYGTNGVHDSNHYYTKISIDGGNTWSMIYDLASLPRSWNGYDSPVELNLSDYANYTIKIAFHANDGPANTGVAYVWFIDDIEIGYPFLDDMGVTNLNAINTIPVVVNDPDTFYVRVRNFGTNPQTNVPLKMTIDNVVVDEINVNLDTLAVLDTFLVWTPTLAGDYTIAFLTELTGDENAANDTFYYDITACPEYHNVPYYKDFNEAWGEWGSNPPFCGWSIVDNGSESPKVWNRNDWFHGSTANPNRSVAAVRYSPVEHQNEWLISPRIDCSVDTQYTLNYWHQYEGYRYANPDTGFVLISTDDGTTWTVIEKYIGGVSQITSYGYKNHDLTSLVNGENDVRVAFRYLAYNAGKWMIDDFSLTYKPFVDILPVAIDVSDTIFTNDTFNVTVRVRNAGRLTLSEPWYLYLQIRDNRDSVLVTGAIAPNETIARTFPKSLAQADTYNLTAWTAYPLDQFPLNNMITRKIRVSGWLQIKNMPSVLPRKGVAQGGAMTCLGDMLYAFRGNNSNEFYAYNPALDSWQTKAELPFGLKSDGTVLLKKVKQGGALVSYGDFIYAFKGGGINEFWMYNPALDSWYRKKDIPKFYMNASKSKKVKIGAALTVYNEIIYAFKGGNTREFWTYLPNQDSWAPRCSLLTVDKKMIKGGGSLVTLDDAIYAFVGGKSNHFYMYSPATDAWVRKAEPSFDPRPPAKAKRLVKDGGSLVALDGKIYAFKGGNTNHFGYYEPTADTWYTLEIIPGIKKVKTGGSLTTQNGVVYALKGGNTKELWSYTPAAQSSPPVLVKNNNLSVINTSTTSTSKLDNQKIVFNIIPNPVLKNGVVYYSVPFTGRCQIKLYNASGRLVTTLIDNIVNAGSYKINLNAREFAQGVYFLTLQTNHDRVQEKLIIQ